MSLAKRLKLLHAQHVTPVALADGKNAWELMKMEQFPSDIGIIMYDRHKKNKRIFYGNKWPLSTASDYFAQRFYETCYRIKKEQAEALQEKEKKKDVEKGLPPRVFKELELVYDYDKNGILLIDMSSDMEWNDFEMTVSYQLGDHTLFDNATPADLIRGLSLARKLTMDQFVKTATWKIQRTDLDAYWACQAFETAIDLHEDDLAGVLFGNVMTQFPKMVADPFFDGITKNTLLAILNEGHKDVTEYEHVKFAFRFYNRVRTLFTAEQVHKDLGDRIIKALRPLRLTPNQMRYPPEIIQLMFPTSVLMAAYMECNPYPNYDPETWNKTGFPRLIDRFDGDRIEPFNFKMHLREPNEEELYTVDVRAFVRLDQAPENIALLKFFVKYNKGDPDYIFSFIFEKEQDAWCGYLGNCKRDEDLEEHQTNTKMMIRKPTEFNHLVGGLGTLGLRVSEDDNDGELELELLIGTGKDQIVGPGETIIGYIENFEDLVDLFSHVDTKAMRDRFVQLEDIWPTMQFE